ncbi:MULTISPECIES: LA_2272 family surface repeat-containing protein [Myxococcus]|uniref:LA_2272 family surface repeat-containing protein n=1 Tax=Myxococcus TaxID=32 RepID=UPI001595F7D1|nr:MULTISPECIES: hypothetical protein [Myxococcus]NVJ28401.1 hypothetical protein [Myxococcus sp. AM011]
MKRKVSVCAGVMAAMVAMSAGAEEAKGVDPAPGASVGGDAGPASVPTVEGPGVERAMVPPPLVEATTVGAVTATDAPVAVATAKSEAAEQEVHVPFNLSILPGLSTSGFARQNLVHDVSIGLIATHARRVTALGLSLGGNWVTHGATGVLATVGANVSGGPVDGTLLAVGGNLVGGDSEGVLASVGTNVVRGTMGGGQLTVGANVTTGEMEGAQLSVGANIAGANVRGAQLTVGGNLAAGTLNGIQMAVGGNVARGVSRGVQMAAGVNVASDLTGLQMSSGVSYAGKLAGAQLSLINVGGDVDGAQVGLVNVAGHVDGAQVGLVNVAGETEGESVGLLSFVGNGQAHVQAWASDVALTNIGLKLGGRHLYTLLTVGLSPPMDGDRRRYTVGAGLGGHIPMGRFYVDVDVLGSSLHANRLFDFDDDTNHVLGQLRVMAGWQLSSRFAVFGGVSSNTLVTWNGSDPWKELGIGPEWKEVSDSGRTTVRTWPGLLAGIQI